MEFEQIVNGRTGEVEIIPLSPEVRQFKAEQAAAAPAKWAKLLRRERNKRLAASDWVVIKELEKSTDGLGLQIPTQWIEYRQALRDLPANTPDPAKPVWPVEPD